MTFKQQIRDLYDKKGYVSDQDAVDISGNEDGWMKKDRIISDYKRFLDNKKFFLDKKIVGKHKGHRMYLVIVDEEERGQVMYKCCKEFFNSINV